MLVVVVVVALGALPARLRGHRRRCGWTSGAFDATSTCGDSTSAGCGPGVGLGAAALRVVRAGVAGLLWVALLVRMRVLQPASLTPGLVLIRMTTPCRRLTVGGVVVVGVVMLAGGGAGGGSGGGTRRSRLLARTLVSA